MGFSNKKEDVVYMELTPYGRHLLSIGKLKPEYYAFFDDDILYIHEINVGGEDFIADVPFEIIDENLFKKIQFRIMNFGLNGGLGSFKINKIEKD